MKKLLEYGRKAMFYIRVLSGYEERRIRSYRLQFQNRIQQVRHSLKSRAGLSKGDGKKSALNFSSFSVQAEAKKVALRKVPEQIILSEVRRMVDEMKALNKKLEDTEAAIDEYFKPIDQEAGMLMKVQLDGEEKRARDMVKTMKAQALLEQAEAERFEQLKATAEAERISKLRAVAEAEAISNLKVTESSQNLHEETPQIRAGSTNS